MDIGRGFDAGQRRHEYIENNHVLARWHEAQIRLKLLRESMYCGALISVDYCAVVGVGCPFQRDSHLPDSLVFNLGFFVHHVLPALTRQHGSDRCIQVIERSKRFWEMKSFSQVLKKVSISVLVQISAWLSWTSLVGMRTILSPKAIRVGDSAVKKRLEE